MVVTLAINKNRDRTKGQNLEVSLETAGEIPSAVAI